MASSRIKGITVEIGGDTTGLDKALKGINKNITDTKRDLKDVERLLKLDPTNTELLRQKQELLGKEVKQTSEKLDALKDAEKQLQVQVKEGKASQEQYDALKREIIATTNELDELEKAASKSNATLSQISAVAEDMADKTGKLADKTKVLSAGAAGILGTATFSSINYEQSFAKVSTLLTDETKDIDAYKQAIIDASNDTGVALDDFAEAVYSAISAGVAEGDAIQFVTDEVKLAKGGFTDMSKAVDVVTTAINGYKMSASDATKINDLLVMTQNKGKTTVDELASSMGAVIPIAASANFSMEQLSAAYALMTKNGIATSQSGTMIKAMLSELSKTGSITDKALKELTGKGFAELEKEGYNLSDVLNMLNEYASDNNMTLKDMFGSTEAGTAALTLATNSGKDFTEMLNDMNNSAGSTETAFEKITGTTGERFKKSFNEIKNTAVELGDTLAPVMEYFADILSSVSEAIGELDSNSLSVIATILIVVASISPLLSIISKVSSGISMVSQGIGFLISNPIVLLIAAIVALVALIATKGDEIQDILRKVDDFMQNIFATDFTNIFGPVLGEALNAFFANIKNIWDSIKLVLNGIIDFIRGVFTGDWQRAWSGVIEILKGLWGGIVSIVKIPINGVIGLLNSAISAINSMIRGFNSIGFDMPKWLGGGSWHPSIPTISHIAYLAGGGILNDGTAVVGEAGPEILTVTGGKTIVQPLTGSAAAGHGLGELMGLLNMYLPYLATGNQIILDTGVLVGETAPMYNEALGEIAEEEKYK